MICFSSKNRHFLETLQKGNVLFICLLLALISKAQTAPCPQGHLTTTKKINIRIDSMFNGPQQADTSNNQNPTSVTTFGRYTFYVYIERMSSTSRYVRVRRYDYEKNVYVGCNLFKVTLGSGDNYHICPTIGVDSLGYIHVTADMHNDYWKYYRSKKPLDLTSGFDDISGELNTLAVGITYPTIFYDNTRGMYLLFRHRNKAGKGNLNHRAGIIKYSPLNKSFTILGGKSYNEKNGTPSTTTTMGWANGFGGNYDLSVGGSWYIKPGHRIYFDGKNRMHFIATVIGSNLGAYTGSLKYDKDNLVGGYESNTHIIYAYSDDFGTTWKTIDGKSITSLPLTPTNASIALNRSAEHDIIGGECELGAFNTNTPVISYKLYSDNSYHAIKWNNKTKVWEELCLPSKKNSVFMCRNVKETGYAAWYNGYTFAYTNDGINWVMTNAQTEGITGSFPRGLKDINSTGLDREYFKQTGNFRYQGTYESFTKHNIYTLYTSVGDTNTMIIASNVVNKDAEQQFTKNISNVSNVCMVYPNSLSNAMDLNQGINDAIVGQNYQIQVCDSIGQLVYSNSITSANAGYLEHTFNGKAFSKGIYGVDVALKGQNVYSKK